MPPAADGCGWLCYVPNKFYYIWRTHKAITMKGYISVDVPTKRYIKAWLIKNFGDRPAMTSSNLVGSMLHAFLNRHQDQRATMFATSIYESSVKLLIPYHVFKNHGHNLNKTNITDFNNFLQHLIKSDMRFYLDFYVEHGYKLKDAIDMVQVKLGLGEDDLPAETIQKDYFRYRQKKNMSMLKGKKVSAKCPFEFLIIQQFERSILTKKEVRKKRIEKLEHNKMMKAIQQELFG